MCIIIYLYKYNIIPNEKKKKKNSNDFVLNNFENYGILRFFLYIIYKNFKISKVGNIIHIKINT